MSLNTLTSSARSSAGSSVSLDRRKLGVAGDSARSLPRPQVLFEQLAVDAEHDVSVHLDEAAVAVEGEAPICGRLGQSLDGLVVQAEVEDGVHHAGHARARAGTHRHQQRHRAVAEVPAHDLLDPRELREHLLLDAGRKAPPASVVVGTHLGRDGEAGGNRHAETCHLGQIRALAAQELAHPRAPLGSSPSEEVDLLRGLRWAGLSTRARLAR
jgi:hypothetical protein